MCAHVDTHACTCSFVYFSEMEGGAEGERGRERASKPANRNKLALICQLIPYMTLFERVAWRNRNLIPGFPPPVLAKAGLS